MDPNAAFQDANGQDAQGGIVTACRIESTLVRRRWLFPSDTDAAEFFYYVKARLGTGVDSAELTTAARGPTEVSLTCSRHVVERMETNAAVHGGEKMDPWKKGRS